MFKAKPCKEFLGVMAALFITLFLLSVGAPDLFHFGIMIGEANQATIEGSDYPFDYQNTSGQILRIIVYIIITVETIAFLYFGWKCLKSR